jgi:hypothetical protein
MAVRIRQSAGSPEDRPPPAVVVTAARVNRRHFIVLFGHPLGLTYKLFDVFVELLLARRNPLSNGYAPSSDDGVNRVAICRLRKEIAALLGADLAKDIVQTGSRAEYRINPRITNADVVLDAGVPELVALRVLSAAELAELQATYRTLSQRWPVEGATVPAAEIRTATPTPHGIVRLTRPRAQTTTTTRLAALA